MKRNFTLLILCATLLLACRKDESTAVNSNSKPNNSANCVVVKSISPDGKNIVERKYEGKIPIENISKQNGAIVASYYLVSEAPKKFTFYSGGKAPKDAKTRIYLNDDGNVEKEVALNLSNDGKTLTEDASQQRIFSYNSKKLLTKISVTLEDDNSVYGISYDNQDRIEKIVISDPSGKTQFYVYDGFTHESQKKNDNFESIVLFDSMSALLMPSLNSTYVKTYNLYSPLLPDFKTESISEYKFTDGKLAEVKNTLKILGSSQVNTVKVTLDCK